MRRSSKNSRMYRRPMEWGMGLMVSYWGFATCYGRGPVFENVLDGACGDGQREDRRLRHRQPCTQRGRTFDERCKNLVRNNTRDSQRPCSAPRNAVCLRGRHCRHVQHDCILFRRTSCCIACRLPSQTFATARETAISRYLHVISKTVAGS